MVMAESAPVMDLVPAPVRDQEQALAWDWLWVPEPASGWGSWTARQGSSMSCRTTALRRAGQRRRIVSRHSCPCPGQRAHHLGKRALIRSMADSLVLCGFRTQVSVALLPRLSRQGGRPWRRGASPAHPRTPRPADGSRVSAARCLAGRLYRVRESAALRAGRLHARH